MSASLVSHHLRLLRAARIVRARAAGQAGVLSRRRPPYQRDARRAARTRRRTANRLQTGQRVMNTHTPHDHAARARDHDHDHAHSHDHGHGHGHHIITITRRRKARAARSRSPSALNMLIVVVQARLRRSRALDRAARRRRPQSLRRPRPAARMGRRLARHAPAVAALHVRPRQLVDSRVARQRRAAALRVRRDRRSRRSSG